MFTAARAPAERGFLARPGQALHVGAHLRKQGAGAVGVDSRLGGEALESRGLGDRRGIVAHAEVAFDSALDTGLRQALRNHARCGLAARHRMDVGRRAARVNHQQRADSTLSGQAVRDQSRALEHRRGRGHQHLVEIGGGAVDALGVDDAVDENLPDRGTRGLDVEHVELRHDVLGVDDVPLRKQPACVVRRSAVACENNGASRRAAGEGGRVVQHDFRIAAVRSACEQDDIGRERGDLFDVAAVRR
jgi:hypothetical protein